MRWRQLAAASLCVVAVSGCGLVTPNDPEPAATARIEGRLPATLLSEPLWQADVDPKASVAVVPEGVVTFRMDNGKLVPVVLRNGTGEPQWSGVGVPPGDSHEMGWVSAAGQNWLVLSVVEGSKATIYSWDGGAGGSDIAPMSKTTLTSATDKPPVVRLSGSGILVSGVPGGPVTVWPDTGETTHIRLPDAETAAVVEAQGDGWIVQHKEAGYSLVSPSGGWSSSAHAPKGVAPDSGQVLASGGGYLLTSWASAKADTSSVLALVRAMDGAVLASGEVGTPPKQDSLGAPVASAGIVVWGSWVFDVAAGTCRKVDLGGGIPTALVDRVVYASGAKMPLPVPVQIKTGGKPTVSMSPAPVVESFNGLVGLDVDTSIPLSGDPTLSVLGISAVGQVIVRDSSGAHLYSVPRR